MLKGRSLAKLGQNIFACSSVIAIAVSATSAQAQDQGQNGSTAQATAEQYDDQAIVVTGSRIVRRDYDSDSPIVTIAPEMLEDSGSVSLDEQLKELPQFTGGAGAQVSSRDVQQLPTNSPGIATVNLRGLGSNRTLVLLDGRRVQPANATMVVDTNVIPKAAISGVEVITGGAASTYGADAVAGVVNFQLKRNFSGIDIDTQYGITERGDGGTWDVSALVGSNFADDRGNAILGVNFSDRRAVYEQDIPFFERSLRDPNFTGGGTFPLFPGYTLFPTSNLVTFDYGSTNNYPTQAAIDAVFQKYGYAAGDVPTGANTDLFFNSDGTLFSTAPGKVSGKPAVNYKGTAYPDTRLLANGSLAPNISTAYASIPMRRYSLFGHAYYDVTDDITLYVQGLFNQSDVETQSTYSSVADQWGIGVTFDAATCGAAVGHPVPQDLCDVLRSRPNPNGPWELNWPATYLGPQKLKTTLTTYEVLVGARGNLPFSDWTFDIFASHGRTGQETTYENFVVLSQAQKLVSLPNYGANSTFYNPRVGLDAKCTSGLNPFTVTTVSDDCRDLISPDLHTLTWLTQDQVEANFQGSLFALPAGDVRAAIGAAYRENDYDYSPDAAFRSDNLTSLTTGVFSVLPASGSIDVKEVYGEVLVPVLSDVPGIQELTLNAGIRYSDYNTAGGVTTWKTTADWQVVDWLKLRGGYQYANRAPNIAELFQPGTYQTVGWADHDPCSNLTLADYGNVARNPDRAKVQALCNAIAGTSNVINDSYVGNQPRLFVLGRDYVVGNPDVKSETAKTWTLGGVVRAPSTSEWLRNLSLSVDYYNIRVDGAIQSASTQFVYEQCFNKDGASNPTYDANNQYCQLINRDSTTGFWLSTTAEYQNLGMLATSGIDASLDWRVPAPGIGEEGSVFLNLSFNWLEKFDVQAVPGGSITHYKGTNGFGAQFDWRLNTTLGYDFGLGSLSLSWRHRPEIQPTATGSIPVKSYDIFDLAGRVKVNDALSLRFGVENLFDKEPPAVGAVPGGNSASGTTDASVYDILGRRFYLGIKASL